MMVNITESEFQAILFCSEQVTGAVEGASDKQYLADADEAQTAIGSLRKKYLAAKKKKEQKDMLMKAAKKMYPNLDRAELNKVVRYSYNQFKEQLENGSSI